jgi:hypothetical protein
MTYAAWRCAPLYPPHAQPDKHGKHEEDDINNPSKVAGEKTT